MEIAGAKTILPEKIFVDMVKPSKHKEYPLPRAIDLATGDCIEEDILQKILLKHRGEVKRMLLTENNNTIK